MAEAAAKAGEDAPEVKKAKKKKKKAAPKAGQPHMVLRIVLGTAGLLLVIGFFLDWIKLGDVGAVQGLELVFSDDAATRALIDNDTQRYLLLVVPGFGLALTAVGFLGVRYSGHIAAVLGVLIVLFGMVSVIVFFFQKTGIGLWLILAGALLAVAAGAFAWARSRADAENKQKSLKVDKDAEDAIEA